MSKRQSLIAAARGLLWERGYHATSPRQILDRAGAGQGSLYHHFRGKKDLAVTALEQLEEEMRGGFERLLDPRLPAVERIARALRGRRDPLKGCPMGRLAGEPAAIDPALREPASRYLAHLQRRIAEILQQAADAGEIRLDERPAALAAALIASVQGGYVLSRLHDDPRCLRLAVDTTLQMFRRFVSVRRRPVLARHALPVVSVGV